MGRMMMKMMIMMMMGLMRMKRTTEDVVACTGLDVKLIHSKRKDLLPQEQQWVSNTIWEFSGVVKAVWDYMLFFCFQDFFSSLFTSWLSTGIQVELPYWLTVWLTMYLPQSGIMFASHLHSHNCLLVVSAECPARLCWPYWRHWC